MEKEVLLRETHHRVKNNLNIVSSLLSLQDEAVDNKEFHAMFLDSQNCIQSMASIHEHLYQTDDLGQVEMQSYIHGMVTDLMHSYGRYTVKIQVEATNAYLKIDTAIPCGLIINEIVTNSLKHAFPSKRRCSTSLGMDRIDILLKRQSDWFNLIISDNDLGLPIETDLTNSNTLGLRLIDISTRQLGGSLDLDRSGNKGSTFTIMFPVPKEVTK